MNTEKAARLYYRGEITLSEFEKIQKENEYKEIEVIMWTDGRDTLCVIDNCMGIAPVDLVDMLIKLDDQIGDNQVGFYYVSRRRER